MRTEVSSVRELPELHLMGHTCTNLNGDLLFVWGGYNDDLRLNLSRNTDLWIYETLTGYWRRKVCTGECPPYLSSCSSCLIGQRMYIFGGHSTLQDNWLNCLYCLDLDTFIWRDVGAQARAEPTRPIRSDKNVCWSWDKKLYVFGGYGWSQVEHYSELLDCQKDLQLAPDFRWPRFGWNNQLVEYDPADRTWRWPGYQGRCPSARAAHAGALMGDKYFVFGGRDCQERLNDLYTLDMKTMHWHQIATIATPGAHLGRHSGALALLGHPGERQTHNNDQDNQLGRSSPEGASGGGNDDDDDEQLDSLADENHRQLVEEMHDVQVGEEEEDDERWNPAAPSGSHDREQTHISNVEGEHREDQDDQQQQQQQQLEADDFEYPHPSHMLERWSLSSTNQTSQSEDGHHHHHHHNDHECLFGSQSHSSTTALAGAAHATTVSHAAAQNLMAHISSAGSAEVAFALRTAERTDQSHSRDYRDLDQRARQDSREDRQQAIDADEAAVDRAELNQLFGAPDERADDDRADDTISEPAQTEPRQPSTPAGRSFCSLTPISANEMLLFGGVDSQDRNLDDCWLFHVATSQWARVDDFKHRRPRLRHTGARTKQNEIVIMGGSSSDRKIDEFCSDVFVLAFEAKSLKRLALDAVSRSVRMKTIQRTRGLPSTLIKLIKLRKQAMALTMRRTASQRSLPAATSNNNNNNDSQ